MTAGCQDFLLKASHQVTGKVYFIHATECWQRFRGAMRRCCLGHFVLPDPPFCGWPVQLQAGFPDSI